MSDLDHKRHSGCLCVGDFGAGAGAGVVPWDLAICHPRLPKCNQLGRILNNCLQSASCGYRMRPQIISQEIISGQKQI